MVLLENSGAEPLTVKLGRLNCSTSERSLPRKVAQHMKPGIPKLRKEGHPERAWEQNLPFTPLVPQVGQHAHDLALVETVEVQGP